MEQPKALRKAWILARSSYRKLMMLVTRSEDRPE